MCHSTNKGINPHLKPERQALKSQNSANKPRLGQGKEGPRRRMRTQTQVQAQVLIKHENQMREHALLQQKEGLQVPQTRQTDVKYIKQELENDITPRNMSRPTVTEIKIPNYPDPLRKPLPRPPDPIVQDDRKISLDLDLEIKKDFEENSQYQEEIIS